MRLWIMAWVSILGLGMALGACESSSKSDGSVDGQGEGDGSEVEGDGSTAQDGKGGEDGVDVPDISSEASAILAVPEKKRFHIKGLTSPVQVIRTEANVPHIYAENRLDLARVIGYIQAEDRFFFMDLQRRLGLGTLSELLGDLALPNDIESRGTGMAMVTDRMMEHISDDFRAYLAAYAEGVNEYIEAVRRGEAEPPSETSFAGILGYDEAVDMMSPFGVRDVLSFATVLMYLTNFETGDLDNEAALGRLEGQFEGAPYEALRREGYLNDRWNDSRGILEANSVPGFGLNGVLGLEGGDKGLPRLDLGEKGKKGKKGEKAAHLKTPQEMVERLADKLYTRMLRMGKDRDAGFGSNIWAVAGTHTKDGAALLANDGHLELSVPPLGYGIGLDTRVFGDGDMHQFGGWLGALPVMLGGTNGDVAWGGVNPFVDITDFYREELKLGEDGLPEASFFEGEWKPLKRVEESYDIAGVSLLGSTARKEVIARYETFDGRLLISIEGAAADLEDEDSAKVNMLGDWIHPQDQDGDDVVTGISVDHVAFDATRWPEAMFQVGLSKNVEEVRQAARGYVGAALFTAAADKDGNIMYTSFQAIPCRGYLPRENGEFLPGGDPTMLIDGTRYRGFAIESDEDGKADEEKGAEDPYACVIGHNDMPHAKNPEEGFVYNANNDPAGLGDDGNIFNDLFYLGGPWYSVRGNTIRNNLAAFTQDGEATGEDMAALQANHQSRLGELFVPYFLEAIERGQADLPEGEGEEEAHALRLKEIYDGGASHLDDIKARFLAWGERGYDAKSGVETFYDDPSADDKEDAVATMIFNAAIRQFLPMVWGDEPIRASRWRQENEVAMTLRMLEGRGENNPLDLASWNAETGESIFFDRADTEILERSDELLLSALVKAVDILSGPKAGAYGGFGTEDKSAWLWGMRHQVRFESMLTDYLGDNPLLQSLLADFTIDTDLLPLAENMPGDDPRRNLIWFPRPGDQWAVDAANPGLSGEDYTHGSGPAMRLWFALKDGDVKGQMILPGGQSALVDSPHFADQVPLWLANDYHPVRFHVEDVVEGAEGRELYLPAEEP